MAISPQQLLTTTISMRLQEFDQCVKAIDQTLASEWQFPCFIPSIRFPSRVRNRLLQTYRQAGWTIIRSEGGYKFSHPDLEEEVES